MALTGSKKAQLGATITLITATIIITFILILFFYFSSTIADFKFRKQADIADAYADKGQALASLKAFLQSPVEIELGGKKVNLSNADLIRINPGDYDALLQQQASAIFKPFGNCYYLSAGNAKSGNSKLKENAVFLTLPATSVKFAEIGLAVSSKCMESIK